MVLPGDDNDLEIDADNDSWNNRSLDIIEDHEEDIDDDTNENTIEDQSKDHLPASVNKGKSYSLCWSISISRI